MVRIRFTEGFPRRTTTGGLRVNRLITPMLLTRLSAARDLARHGIVVAALAAAAAGVVVEDTAVALLGLIAAIAEGGEEDNISIVAGLVT